MLCGFVRDMGRQGEYFVKVHVQGQSVSKLVPVMAVKQVKEDDQGGFVVVLKDECKDMLFEEEMAS